MIIKNILINHINHEKTNHPFSPVPCTGYAGAAACDDRRRFQTDGKDTT